MSIKPENILPDAINTTEINGVTIRKGTMGAVLANAEILASASATEEEKLQAETAIQALVPALIALGVHRHIIWKNPDIQKIFDEVLAK